MLPIRRTDLDRAERRALAVAHDLGFQAAIDPEIPTTWLVEGRWDGRKTRLRMGSPRIPTGMLSSKTSDWLELEVAGDTCVPEGIELRPTRRTVFEWRDGAPGESPDFRVGDRGYVLEVSVFGVSFDFDGIITRATMALQALPFPGWVHARSHGFRLRPDHGPTEPVAAARSLLDYGALWF